MKPTRIVLSLIVVLAATAVFAQTRAQKEFKQIASLSGAWAGKDSQGMPVQVNYRVTGGGSAIMSEIDSQKPDHQDGMITMFNMDGANRLLMTHYCSAGNQPRMAASSSPDGKTITFNFVDGTNLAASPGHMQRVVFTFVDANHHIEEWHFALPGKEMVERFNLQRKG